MGVGERLRLCEGEPATPMVLLMLLLELGWWLGARGTGRDAVADEGEGSERW